MFTLTYFKVMFTKGFSAGSWHDFLESRLIPELRDLDADKNGIITPKEIIRLVKRVIASAFL